MKSIARLLAPVLVAGAVLSATTGTASADYTVSFVGVPQTILLFEGTSDADKVTVRSHGPGTGLLDIDEGSDGDTDFAVDTAFFDSIQVFGRDGNDAITFDDSGGPVPSDDATQIAGGTGNDTILGGDGGEDISGGAGNDTIDGRGGADKVSAGTEDDTIRWSPGGGNDTVGGGTGSDAFELTGSAGPENIALEPDGSAVRLRDVSGLNTSLSDIETLHADLQAGDDTFAVRPGLTAPRVEILGGAGADRLGGTAAGDELRGGPGNDALDGDAGNDALFGDEGSDALTGAAGADSFHCGGVGDTFDLNAEDALDADCRPPAPDGAGEAAPQPPSGQATDAQPQPAPQVQPVAASCIVPKLKKLTLAKAKKRLSAAHCKLGKVKKPRARGPGRLVVRTQSVKPGAVRKANAKVSVRLVRRP